MAEADTTEADAADTTTTTNGTEAADGTEATDGDSTADIFSILEVRFAYGCIMLLLTAVIPLII